MTNRPSVESYTGALDAILLDCGDAYPLDRLEWERDSKRIHLGNSSRGLAFFTLDLPALADALMRGLSSGRLTFPNPPAFSRRKWKGSPIPRLFSGLWLRIFDEFGLLRDDCDETAVFFLMTLLSVWKKVEVPCSESRVVAAYKEYFTVDDSLPPAPEWWGDNLSDDDNLPDVQETSLEDFGDSSPLFTPNRISAFGTGQHLEYVLRTCQHVADRAMASLGSFSYDEVVGRHGPGAVADAKWGTPKWEFPSWCQRLNSLFPVETHALLHDALSVRDYLPHLVLLRQNDEPESYLTDVPKTAKTPRLIAEEPTAHQWIQQGLSDTLRKAVKDTFLRRSIDFFSQEPSQEACIKASESGQQATIDLSSASDRLSCSVVQRVFRRNLCYLRALAASRTRFVRQDYLSDRPGLIRLRKFASMGSALTFPVQSIVFAVLAIGVGKSLNRKQSLHSLAREVRVFGDDIICPRSWVPLLTRVLERLQLKVNSDKSFSEGNFRESCGIYAFRGYDVTPFRIGRPLGSTDSVSVRSNLDCSRNAFLKGLWRTSLWLESRLPRGFRPPAVDRRATPIGLPTSSRGADPSLLKRWNHQHQTYVFVVDMLKHLQPRRVALMGRNSLSYLIGRSYIDRSTGEGLLGSLPNHFDWVGLPGEPRGVTRLAVVRKARVPVSLFVS
jgi:hypothetical protein